MKCGLTADCTDLQIGDHIDPATKQEHKNLLFQIRPAFGGNIIATIVNPHRWPQMATVREGVMPMSVAEASGKGEIIRFPAGLDGFELPLTIEQSHRQPKRVNLKAARIIVSGSTFTLRSTTLKPAPSSITRTRSLPISWISPLTVRMR